ncbi:hypothetical protein PoB_003850900 [Plakobranchus ocellatus]|uniref:Uncharacterized protein n=1 Tax=Plakobranchus ocellatus TaxID=259542 RepID=A0AAV4AW35_9GAST|nr:hypothetical protein PoB_003850900 [Plakobranchus ocellatus]
MTSDDAARTSVFRILFTWRRMAAEVEETSGEESISTDEPNLCSRVLSGVTCHTLVDTIGFSGIPGHEQETTEYYCFRDQEQKSFEVGDL